MKINELDYMSGKEAPGFETLNLELNNLSKELEDWKAAQIKQDIPEPTFNEIKKAANSFVDNHPDLSVQEDKELIKSAIFDVLSDRKLIFQVFLTYLTELAL